MYRSTTFPGLKVSQLVDSKPLHNSANSTLASALLTVVLIVAAGPTSIMSSLRGYVAVSVIALVAAISTLVIAKSTTKIFAPWLLLIFLTYCAGSSFLLGSFSNGFSLILLLASLLVAGIIIASRLTTDQALGAVVRSGTWSLVLSLVLLAARPGDALQQGMLSGVYGHKNILGYVLAAAFAANLYRRTPVRLTTQVVTGIFLIGGVYFTDSTTSLLACAFSCSLAVFLHVFSKLNRKSPIRPIFLIGSSGALTLLVITLLDESASFLSLLGKSPTLSARTSIWNFVTYMWYEKPWTGYGLGSVWAEGSTTRAYIQQVLRNPAATHAHSGYLDTLLQTGIIGAFILFAAFLCTLFVSWKFAPTARWPFALIAFSLFYNLVESRFFSPHNWLLIVLVATIAARTAASSGANKAQPSDPNHRDKFQSSKPYSVVRRIN